MDHLDRILAFYLKSVATPHCLSLLSDLRKQQWDSAVSRKVNPEAYRFPEAYLKDAQASAFFSKNASMKHPNLDPEAKCLENWWEAEHRNALTNIRFRRYLAGPLAPDDVVALEFFEGVKKRVARWLGPLPKELHSKFGPGVTLCCRGRVATVADKMTVSPTTTRDAWQYAEHFLSDTAWFRSLIKEGVLTYRDGCLSGASFERMASWASVPKNAKTDRSIEIGPSLNIAFQLHIGSVMKERFRSRGWDLLNAADDHRRVARAASVDGLKATIDLKQASDSMCRNLVKFLLPPDWSELLDQLRTRIISIKGKNVVLEKFSGMGNGFTFELESVIFMSIAQEVCSILGLPCTAGRDVYVFGDDIIVPTAASGLLIKVLLLSGFETNIDKTFVDGPFRESCGGDFYKGVGVRPFFLKENPNEPQDWIAFANGIYRLANDQSLSNWYRRVLHGCWLLALRAIPSSIRRCRGPVILGDIVIHDEPSKWQIKTRNSIRRLRTYKPVTRRVGQRRGGSVVEWDNFPHSVKLATILLGQGVSGSYRNPRDRTRFYDLGIIPRNPLLSYKFGWVPFS